MEDANNNIDDKSRTEAAESGANSPFSTLSGILESLAGKETPALEDAFNLKNLLRNDVLWEIFKHQKNPEKLEAVEGLAEAMRGDYKGGPTTKLERVGAGLETTIEEFCIDGVLGTGSHGPVFSLINKQFPKLQMAGKVETVATDDCVNTFLRHVLLQSRLDPKHVAVYLGWALVEYEKLKEDIQKKKLPKKVTFIAFMELADGTLEGWRVDKKEQFLEQLKGIDKKDEQELQKAYDDYALVILEKGQRMLELIRHCHSRGVVHRDIKPESKYLYRVIEHSLHPRASLLLSVRRADGGCSSSRHHRHPVEGVAVVCHRCRLAPRDGRTLRYRPALVEYSPHQGITHCTFFFFSDFLFFGEILKIADLGTAVNSKKSDLYSFAVSLYEMLALADGKAYEEEFWEHCSAGNKLKDLMERMLQEEPRDRPETEAVEAELKGIMGSLQES